MTKKKLVASHYTVAQVSRLLGINYNRIRSVFARVPGSLVDVVGTKMVPAERVPALRNALAAIDREKKA
jgi:hypothetical protein